MLTQVSYLVKNKDRSEDDDTEWKPAAKAALKKAANYADQQKKKAGKEKELAVRQKKEAEEREKALDEAKKIVIKEDLSLPKAVRINLGEKRPEIVKLGSGKRSEDVDYSSPDRGTRVRVYGRVHRGSASRAKSSSSRCATASGTCNACSRARWRKLTMLLL